MNVSIVYIHFVTVLSTYTVESKDNFFIEECSYAKYT